MAFYVHENLNLIAQPFNQEKNVGGLKLKVGKCNYGWRKLLCHTNFIIPFTQRTPQ